MFCTFCGKEIDSASDRCEFCGNPVIVISPVVSPAASSVVEAKEVVESEVEMKRCIICGNKIPKESRQCSHCHHIQSMVDKEVNDSYDACATARKIMRIMLIIMPILVVAVALLLVIKNMIWLGLGVLVLGMLCWFLTLSFNSLFFSIYDGERLTRKTLVEMYAEMDRKVEQAKAEAAEAKAKAEAEVAKTQACECECEESCECAEVCE